MRFIPVVFTTLAFSSVSLGSTQSDSQDIQDLNVAYAFALDALDFAVFDTIFTTNATYQINGSSVPIARGLPSIKAGLSALAPPGTLSQHAISTQLITLATQRTYTPTLAAKGMSYVTGVYFGRGNLDGQIVTIYGFFSDTYVKTSQQKYGGWRIETRVLNLIVRYSPVPTPAAIFWIFTRANKMPLGKFRSGSTDWESADFT